MSQVELQNNEGNENPLRLIQMGTEFQKNPHNRFHGSEALVSFSLLIPGLQPLVHHEFYLDET